MWIYTKNDELINTDKVTCFNVCKGKNYYDDDAVLQTYHYICADGKKIIKLSNQDESLQEINNIKRSIADNVLVYEANGVKLNDDENNSAE